MNLTSEQIRRVEQALVETHGLIAKEMKYSPQFQKADYLAELRAHVVKLETMIADNCIAA